MTDPEEFDPLDVLSSTEDRQLTRTEEEYNAYGTACRAGAASALVRHASELLTSVSTLHPDVWQAEEFGRTLRYLNELQTSLLGRARTHGGAADA